MNTTSKQIIDNLMVATIRILAVGALLVPGVGTLNLSVFAQDHHQQANSQEVITGKKGELHFTTQVKAGNAILKPGMYQVQHLMEGSGHVIVFKEMGMPAGYKMGNTPVGKEVARVQCKVEPVTKAVKNTQVTLRTNVAGEKEIADVQVAGEAFKHLL
jgi:uncharacterized protein YwlG (UPF0340 family)